MCGLEHYHADSSLTAKAKEIYDYLKSGKRMVFGIHETYVVLTAADGFVIDGAETEIEDVYTKFKEQQCVR
jgi:hypothetical protein